MSLKNYKNHNWSLKDQAMYADGILQNNDSGVGLQFVDGVHDIIPISMIRQFYNINCRRPLSLETKYILRRKHGTTSLKLSTYHGNAIDRLNGNAIDRLNKVLVYKTNSDETEFRINLIKLTKKEGIKKSWLLKILEVVFHRKFSLM